MTVDDLMQGALDTALLGGLLLTALFSIFKAGRWFGGMISAVAGLTASMAAFRKDFERHVTDEDIRFAGVESKLDKHGESIKCVHDQVARLAKSANGKAARR